MNPARSARITLWVNRLIMGLLGVMTLALPRLLLWYTGVRPMGLHVPYAIAIAFYLCLPPVFWALLAMDRMLRSILEGEIFVSRNVSRIRQIRWCCVAVSLICLPSSHFYPPLIFLFAIMGFLALVVNVLGQVMKAAVQIREENDLTV